MFADHTLEAIKVVAQQSFEAFKVYRNSSLKQRAALMRSIAVALEACGDELIHTAMQETNLPETRLRGERARTIFQLTSYAAACERGEAIDARIDTAEPNKNPPKPDIRKMMIGLGPIVVFGSSNFPFAYSTAGGDTASALAAGCSVIVKAHPAHPKTSTIVAKAIDKAVANNNLPASIFQHVYGASFEIGKALVVNEHIKAVGFTGSFTGGKQLFDWAHQRKEPIPVFAEMGSINPVFLLNEKLSSSPKEIAQQFAASITLGVGQFCTNPGLIIGLKSEALTIFIDTLGKAIHSIQAAKMLHEGIAKAYQEKKIKALQQNDVELVNESELMNDGISANPTIATVSAKTFLNNSVLHQEVFGPYSLIVQCEDIHEMNLIAENLEGQLTSTIIGTIDEIQLNDSLIQSIKNICGRIIFNGVPTGVEVCYSMQHGGPFPATTDSRFSAVGPDAIQRFVRPISFQNWPDALLPDELKNANPLNIWRIVNNELTKSTIP